MLSGLGKKIARYYSFVALNGGELQSIFSDYHFGGFGDKNAWNTKSHPLDKVAAADLAGKWEWANFPGGRSYGYMSCRVGEYEGDQPAIGGIATIFEIPS